MHFMPLITRSGHFSPCLSSINSAITTTTAAIHIYIILVTTILSFTSVTARVIGNPDKIDSSNRNPQLSFEKLQKQLIVDEFKKRILDHMGWSEPPKFTGGSRNITRLRELYRNEIQEFLNTTNPDYIHSNNNLHNNNNNDDVENQNTFTELKYQLISSDKRLKVPVTFGNTKSSNTFSTHFSFTRPNTPELNNNYGTSSVESAKLSLRFRHLLPRHLASTNSRFLIKVYLVDSKSSLANLTSNSVYIKSFLINPRKSSNVIELNIEPKDVSSSLFSTPLGDTVISFKLIVTEIALPFQGMPKYSTKSIRSSQFSKIVHSHISVSPSMEVKLLLKNDRTKPRSRRSVECSDDISACCNRKSVYINFEDIGLDEWVLAPEGYTAYYCTGICPVGFKAVRSFSRIKAKMHEQNPNFPAPNCASSSSAPLALMHVGDMDRVVWSDFEDMIVTGCQCY